MNLRLTGAVCVLGAFAYASPAQADRCSGMTDVIFCDDFDDYCDPAPPGDGVCEHDYGVCNTQDGQCVELVCDSGANAGNPCTTEADCQVDLCLGGSNPGAGCVNDSDCPDIYVPPDNDAFRAVWPPLEGACDPDRPYSLATQWMWKPNGYAVWVPQKGDVFPPTEKLARHVHDLTGDIQAINPARNAVNGSGAASLDNPDALKGSFYLNLSPQNAVYGNYIYYTELYLDDDRAPTNFLRVNCHPEAQGPYQKLIPADDQGQVHASFAFGLMAIMDDVNGNPCDVDMGRKPSAWRAFVYDGKEWVRLKGPAFGLPIPDDADFRPWPGFNRFEFYIGTDNIEIRLYNPRADEYCENGWIEGAQCDCTLLETGDCDEEDGTCVADVCEGGMRDGLDCNGDADCAATDLCVAGMGAHAECGPSEFLCEASLCEGGPRDGLACTEDVDCEGIACIGGGSEGEPCTTDDDCAGWFCWIDADCRDALDCSGYFVALVPRQYPGAFNRIALGAGKGVDQTVPVCDWVGFPSALKCVGGTNSGNACVSDADCPPSVGQCVSNLCQGGANHGNACTSDAGCPDFEECMDAIGYNDMTVDEVVLYDGVLQSVEGACCLPNGTCIYTATPSDCENTLGGQYHGTFTSCEDVVCCPDPFADADGDGDVDQDDFGKLQACITGHGGGVPAGCECFNHDTAADEPDIDEDDYALFEACASGPDVAADPSCDGLE